MSEVPLYQHPRPFARSCRIYTAQPHHGERISYIDATKVTSTPISRSVQECVQFCLFGCRRLDERLLTNLRIENGELLCR